MPGAVRLSDKLRIMARKKVSKRLQQIGGEKSYGPPPSMMGRPSDTQLVELGLFVSATTVGLMLLLGLSVFYGIRAIENHLESQVDAVLAANEIDDVTVDARGVDLSIRGTVSVEEQKETIKSFAESLEGVGKVETELEYVPPIVVEEPDIVAAPITVTWAGGQVTVVGELSDESSRDAVIEALGGYFPNGVNADGLTIKEGAPSERDWLSKVLTLIQIGADTLNQGEIFVNADQQIVQMTGEYENRQARREATDKIDDVVAQMTFAFVNSLTIPEAPAFTPEQVVELQENLDDLIEGKVVEFELNSDVLTAVGKALLDEILDALEKFPNVPIEIAGHTDNQGTPEDNLDLSERRAHAALDYLVAHGQDPDRFVVVGYGEEQPIASNDTAEGRARNRRIEFRALGE
jgi:OOP family OmpA-OmpF porin